MNNRVPPHGPRLASSNLSKAPTLSDFLRSQLHFCCPTHALIAKARVVLAIVPRVAITVLIVKANFQAVTTLPFSRMRTALTAMMDATLVVNARISKAQDAIVLREGGNPGATLLSQLTSGLCFDGCGAKGTARVTAGYSLTGDTDPLDTSESASV
jgi:hypothetical protein